MPEYSQKMLKKSREIATEKVDTTPIFLPVGYTQPETLNDCLNRILAHSAGQGISLQQAYDMLTGEFDGDDDFDADDFGELMDDDDEFEQSSYAEYETPAPPKPTPTASAPAPTAPSVTPQNVEATVQESGAEVTESNTESN